MAEERINREIVKALSTDPYLVPHGSVCKATLAEWTEFQESENQEVRSSCMEWIAGDVYIVELSTPERGTFLGSFLGDIARQSDAVYRYLKGHSAAYVKARLEGEPQLDPDASYERHRVAFAARLWYGRLPDVRFVLCVAVTDNLAMAEYKLFIVRLPARPLRDYRADIVNPDQDPVYIVTPRT